MGKWVVGVAILLTASACTSAGQTPEAVTSSVPSSGSTAVSGTSSGAGSEPATTPTTQRSGEAMPGCGGFDGEPFQSAESVVVTEIDGSDLGIRAAVYPRPDHEGNPWSEWGQGIVTADGRYFSAIGDHLGADGNSYVYEFDPATGVLTRIADVASLVGATSDDWGHGKIHAQMVAGPCGEIYAASYWGSRRGIESVDYSGGILMRIDPSARTVSNLGAPVPAHGIPSLASWPEGGLLYGEAADPTVPTGSNEGPFFVYDLASGEVVFSDADPSHTGFRSIAVDAQGRAYVSFGDGLLNVYDPATNSFTGTVDIPGGRIRAASAPAPDGTVYAASDRPDAFFSIGPDGTVTDLGVPEGYTASMVVDTTGTVVYSLPGAHGDGYDIGTPIVELDPATGAQSTLVELAPLIEQSLGLRVGGTYGISIDHDAGRLFMTLNAGGPNDRDPFGQVVLVEVTLP